MCDCIAWHPIWGRIARTARVRRPAVLAVFFVLREAPDLPFARDDGAIAEAVGARHPAVTRILLLMRGLGIVDRENRPLGAWAVTKRDAGASPTSVTASPREPNLLIRPDTGDVAGDESVTRPEDRVTRRRRQGCIRSARYRAKQRAARRVSAISQPAGGPSQAASPSVTAPAPLSLFPDQDALQERGKETREGRASPDAGFAELSALWPWPNRMTEAQAVYRRARQEVGDAELLLLARKYLATKEPPYRYCQFLVNWLNTKPWRDPVLPLSATPQLVAVAQPPPLMTHGLGPPGDVLIGRIGAPAFGQWFGGVSIERASNAVVVSVGSPFIRNWVAQHYEPDICAAWGVRRAEFQVVEPGEREAG